MKAAVEINLFALKYFSLSLKSDKHPRQVTMETKTAKLDTDLW